MLIKTAMLSGAKFLLKSSLESASKEKGRTGKILNDLIRHPIKVVASFIFAPFLIIKIAMKVNNPIRRFLAILGLLVSFICSYIAGTAIGTFAGAVFVATHIGFLTAAGFILGTTISVIMSVLFSIVVFNSVSFLFLKMNNEEVINYLDEISS